MKSMDSQILSPTIFRIGTFGMRLVYLTAIPQGEILEWRSFPIDQLIFFGMSNPMRLFIRYFELKIRQYNSLWNHYWSFLSVPTIIYNAKNKSIQMY